MRWIMICLGLGWAMAGAVQAQEQPATQPPVQRELPRAIVLPFAEIGASGDAAWVGNAMQANIVATLAQSGLVDAIRPQSSDNSPPPRTEEQALTVARAARTSFVVFGTYHILGQQIRVNGSVRDTVTGRIAGTLRASGSLQDLFDLEDQIAGQTGRAIMYALAPAGQTQAEDAPIPPAQSSGPLQQNPDRIAGASGSTGGAAAPGTNWNDYQNRYYYSQQPYAPLYPYAYPRYYTYPYPYVNPYPYYRRYPYRPYPYVYRPGWRVYGGTSVSGSYDNSGSHFNFNYNDGRRESHDIPRNYNIPQQNYNVPQSDNHNVPRSGNYNRPMNAR